MRELNELEYQAITGGHGRHHRHPHQNAGEWPRHPHGHKRHDDYQPHDHKLRGARGRGCRASSIHLESPELPELPS